MNVIPVILLLILPFSQAADLGCRSVLYGSPTIQGTKRPLDVCYASYDAGFGTQSSLKYSCNADKTAVIWYQYYGTTSCDESDLYQTVTISTDPDSFDCTSPVCSIAKYRITYNTPSTPKCNGTQYSGYSEAIWPINTCLQAYIPQTDGGYIMKNAKYQCMGCSVLMYTFEMDDTQCSGNITNTSLVVTFNDCILEPYDNYGYGSYWCQECGYISTFSPTKSPITPSPIPNVKHQKQTAIIVLIVVLSIGASIVLCIGILSVIQKCDKAGKTNIESYAKLNSIKSQGYGITTK